MSGETIDSVVQALIEVAAGKVQHLYRGTCPDAIEGFDSRDPQCPACRVLIAAQQTAPQSTPVGVEDGPIDASDNAEYIEHCADRLERCGLPVTAGALRVIAHEHRTLAQQLAPPSAPVGVKTLSEFMTEQEALHPGIHDKVQAATDELRASLAQQSALPAAQATGVDAPGSRAWMAEVCRAAALSLAAHGVRNDQLSKVADWIAQQPAAVDEGFVSRLAEALTAQDWDVDPDEDGSGIAQLRAAVFAAARITAQTGGSNNDR